MGEHIQWGRALIEAHIQSERPYLGNAIRAIRV